nr:hypothetical protein [uncultured Tateyamaria sp.]
MFFIEQLCYAPWAHAFSIQNKNALNDSSLFRNDRSFTRLSHEIAICHSASRFSGKNTASLSSPHLFTQITDKLFSDHSHHSDMQLIDFTVMDCEQPHIGKAKLFVQLCRNGKIP